MKNTQKRFKIFLDTSVLLSGLNSPLGASGFIISLFKLQRVIIVISPEVIVEAERAIKSKFPLLKTPLLDLIASNPSVIKSVSKKELESAHKIIDSEDTPIFAGALKSKVDFLITLDKRFQKLVKDNAKFGVLSPGEFLKIIKSK